MKCVPLKAGRGGGVAHRVFFFWGGGGGGGGLGYDGMTLPTQTPTQHNAVEALLVLSLCISALQKSHMQACCELMAG